MAQKYEDDYDRGGQSGRGRSTASRGGYDDDMERGYGRRGQSGTSRGSSASYRGEEEDEYGSLRGDWSESSSRENHSHGSPTRR